MKFIIDKRSVAGVITKRGGDEMTPATDDDRLESDLREILVRRGYTPTDLELGGVDYAMLVELVLYVQNAINESRKEQVAKWHLD